jgi:signal transduction histidine kinase
MLISEVLLDQSNSTHEHRQRLIRQALAIPISLVLAWWVAAQLLSPVFWLLLIVYSFSQLVFLSLPSASTTLIRWAGVGLDALLGLFLVFQSGVVSSAIYPLYSVIALRAISAYPQTPAAIAVPFLLGPLFLFTQLVYQRAAPLSFSEIAGQLTLLIGSQLFGIGAIAITALQQREQQRLADELTEAQRAAQERIAQIEASARDLRSRVRERTALEEGLRAITSTLTLDDVLRQIIDSTMQMFGPARVHAIVLSLANDDQFVHRASVLEGAQIDHWANVLAQRVIDRQSSLMIADLTTDRELAAMLPAGKRTALSVPLIIGSGELKGALSVVSSARVDFTNSDLRNLSTFALQAGIAISNAELHSDLAQQQALIQAVVHDIRDGLVVVNASAEVLLVNPPARDVLTGMSGDMTGLEQILGLADTLLANDRHTISFDIRLDASESEGERIYRAIGSRVQRQDDDETFVAIVLHDITAQKNEEKGRAQFISMVSHELRNPLNSLNGFVKIVLQGRAGSLTPMQEEFLQVAVSQIDLLKARIAELQEFNQLDGGHLALEPQLNHLPLLINATLTRLSVQAEQSGLHLINHVPTDLPEIFFDSGRIGQVLSNLVENAIKFTPPGGTITVEGFQRENELVIAVRDTGLGIALDEHRRIFEPFVQGKHGSSRRGGGHMGLGLAICKQIIEGHRGHIWVESEINQGSSFFFSLPLTATTEEALQLGDKRTMIDP